MRWINYLYTSRGEFIWPSGYYTNLYGANINCGMREAHNDLLYEVCLVCIFIVSGFMLGGDGVNLPSLLTLSEFIRVHVLYTQWDNHNFMTSACRCLHSNRFYSLFKIIIRQFLWKHDTNFIKSREKSLSTDVYYSQELQDKNLTVWKTIAFHNKIHKTIHSVDLHQQIWTANMKSNVSCESDVLMIGWMCE